MGVDDSLSSGNCNLGTNQFVARYGINTSITGGIRGDILLGLESSSYTKRAVAYAIANKYNQEIQGK